MTKNIADELAVWVFNTMGCGQSAWRSKGTLVWAMWNKTQSIPSKYCTRIQTAYFVALKEELGGKKSHGNVDRDLSFKSKTCTWRQFRKCWPHFHCHSCRAEASEVISANSPFIEPRDVFGSRVSQVKSCDWSAADTASTQSPSVSSAHLGCGDEGGPCCCACHSTDTRFWTSSERPKNTTHHWGNCG